MVENEIHFLFECSSFENQRKPHIDSLSNIYPILRNLDNTQKMNLLFFDEHTPHKALEQAAAMLQTLMSARDTLNV